MGSGLRRLVDEIKRSGRGFPLPGNLEVSSSVEPAKSAKVLANIEELQTDEQLQAFCDAVTAAAEEEQTEQ